jgi:hypothetical protein
MQKHIVVAQSGNCLYGVAWVRACTHAWIDRYVASRARSYTDRSVTRECDVWHNREQLQAPEGPHFRLLRLPIQVPRVPIQVLEKRRGWRMVGTGEW